MQVMNLSSFRSQAGRSGYSPRITEGLRLAGTPQDTWSNPLLRQDCPEQVAQDHIQTAFEVLQVGRLQILQTTSFPAGLGSHSKEGW